MDKGSDASGRSPNHCGSAGAGPTPHAVLDARVAAIVLSTYLAVQFLGGVFIGAVLRFGGGVIGLDVERLTVPLFGVVFIIGGSAASFVALKTAPRQITDRSPTGAALISGGLFPIVQGLVLGAIIAAVWLGLTALLTLEKIERGSDPLTEMARSTGVSQWTWFLLSLMAAPVIEEGLFRGVLYGGCRHSFGPFWAAVVTTSLFVLTHCTDVIRFPPAAGVLAAISAAGLWCRLRFRAIGPAIALHCGYNTVLAFGVIR